MKTATIAQLTITAASVTASAVGAVFTAGLSTLGGAAAVQVGRLAVREIIQELIEKLVKSVIPRLKKEAAGIFGDIIGRIRRYLDDVLARLRRQSGRGDSQPNRAGNGNGHSGGANHGDKEREGRHRTGDDISGELDELPVGRRRHVRVVESEAELRDLYGKWSEGGTSVESKNYDGTRVRLPDGTTVGWRHSSDSGGATIDLVLPDGQKMKVHIDG